MGTRGLSDRGVGGGLTRQFWDVFGGVLEDYFCCELKASGSLS